MLRRRGRAVVGRADRSDSHRARHDDVRHESRLTSVVTTSPSDRGTLGVKEADSSSRSAASFSTPRVGDCVCARHCQRDGASSE